tara:strand:+ start:477 stop:761 length:285 start_codon:yes stop_codon:yes gene_type:complete
METVTIERTVLEWLTHEALEMRFEGLDIAHECDRVAAINVHKAIEALGTSEQLQAEAIAAREKMWADHREHVLRVKAEEEAELKAAVKAAKAAK